MKGLNHVLSSLGGRRRVRIIVGVSRDAFNDPACLRKLLEFHQKKRALVQRRALQERMSLRDFWQVIGGYFELLYKAWKKSKNEDFVSFLTSRQVLKDKKKLFSGK